MATFTAYVFNGDRTAHKVLGELINSSNDYIWIDDVAVVAKKEDGRVTIHSTWAQDNMGAEGLGWGALTGGVLGAMAAGAPGAAMGAASSSLAGAALGGSFWGLLGASADEALDDPRLDEFAREIKRDTSALVLVSDEEYLSEYEMALKPYGYDPYDGVIFQVPLNETDVNYIKKKMKESK